MKTRSFAVAMLILSAGSLPALAQAQSPCGRTVTVQRADTLSSIAQRCDVNEADILRANPGVNGSADLAVGEQLRMPAASSSSTAERLGSAAREAGDALSDFAKDLGSSVEDLLQKNPDLHERLRRLGDRLDIPGIDMNRAKVSVSPESGTTGSPVTISAVGLPKNVPVKIGGGAPHAAYEVLETARTSPDGTLQVNVRIPDWAGKASRIVFVIAGADGSWQVRSSPFAITGTKL